METQKKGPGRPTGSTAADPDAELDMIVLRRRDEEADMQEAARARARWAFKIQKRRAERREAWISHHDKLGRQHESIAQEHFYQAAQLRRETT